MGRLAPTLLILMLPAGALLLPASGEAQSWRTITTTRALSAEESLEVEVRYGAGQVRISPGESDLLYRMELRYDEEVFEPISRYEDGRLRLGIEGGGRGIRLGRTHSGGTMDLELTSRIPMTLDLEFGAVQADLELGGLPLTDLRLSTGASKSQVTIGAPNPREMARAELSVGAADFSARGLGNLNARRIEVNTGVGNVVLDFSGRGRESTEVSVNMGLGALELRFPREAGVRITRSTFLTSFNAPGLERRGESYYSPDWDESSHRISLTVDGALGSIRVAWID